MTSPPVVVFPDAELVTVTVLRAALDKATTVGTEWPDDLLQAVQGGVVSVTRGGGAIVQRDVLEDVTLDIDILAADKGQAHDLAQLVRAHLRAVRGTTVDGAQIYGVADVSLIWLPYEPDTDTAVIPRYVLVMQMRLRGRPALT
ncbi:hypothetical protein AB0P07_11760 [Streptomyces sp. NPDC085944]|uniref:hypothetical protein n=1 Tax=Streptomyces sp. NPDC085944 TaxID=3154962 RepID=UPI003443A9B0